LLSTDAWNRRILRNHQAAQRYFRSSDPKYAQRLTRLDVIVNGNPFSEETVAIVEGIEKQLTSGIASGDPELQNTKVLMTGATPSIRDLRSVTLQDNRRIKIAVVIAVFTVLLIVIRRVRLCLYLIATVLLSYYATLGLTQWFFQAAYGSDWVGLDWKLPLFLFVILVAVGQDYNVYLVTRIVEEQRRLGWISALRRAVSRTGGIITACGLVMAATFFSMTASAWFPPIATWFGFPDTNNGRSLRGIIELGFALGLGVLIDTFYVRTILVPSFVAAMGRYSSKRASAQRASN
jgi:RND superfamily putative drug exporter